jgi:hypothetical protein
MYMVISDVESEFEVLVDRYYDPATGQFLTVDPLVDETGQPYAYTDDDPVNAVDPNGLDCGPFSFACSAYDATAGGVKTAATDTGHFLSDPNRWRNEANYLAGVGNGIVSTVTFGQVHISEPYCGELGWTYGLGTGIGVAGTVVGGGAGADALGAGDAAYSSETFGTSNPLIGNSSINNGTAGILNQVGSALRLGWSVAPSDDGYAPVLRLAIRSLKIDLLHTSGF